MLARLDEMGTVIDSVRLAFSPVCSPVGPLNMLHLLTFNADFSRA
jgi:hypothetical protein